MILMILLMFCLGQAWAQAPSAIQFFMPGGGMPSRPLRFTLILPDGRPEILFTDTKGKFPITGDLVRDGDYSLTVDGDKRTFETTTLRFRLLRGTVTYLPVFLLPMKTDALPKATMDVAEYDTKTPAEARAAYDQAMKLIGQNKPDEAISEFTRALAIYPQYVSALNDLGVLYQKLNRLDEAAAAFTQAISLSARFYLPQLNLALLRHRQSRYSEAIALFTQLLKEHPSLSAARITYAESLETTQQWDEAEQQLREALKDAKLDRADRANAHLRLGLKLNRDARYQAAADELEKSAALGPDSAFAHLYLGAALAQLKKTADAERELLKAYEIGEKAVATAQLLLGQIYYNQQKDSLALHAFEQYLADMPNAPNAAQVRQVVTNLKATVKK
ncbi:MAG: tetratricopeptide repeat protein [Acidobacteriota bacterium]